MPKPGQGGSGVGLTLVHGQQRREAALVPDGDEQRPGKHDEDNGKDVPSLRHLQGWLHPQLLITWAMATSGGGEWPRSVSSTKEKRIGIGPAGQAQGGRSRTLASNSHQRSHPPIAEASLPSPA